MRCETCQGVGKVTYDQHPEPKPQPFGSVFPCPECAGSGITHCCDGLTACNDIPEGPRTLYDALAGDSDKATARGELHYDPRITEAARKSREGWRG